MKKVTLISLMAVFAFTLIGCSGIENLLGKAEGIAVEKEVLMEVVEKPIYGAEGEALEDENGEIVTEKFERPVIGADGEPIYRWEKSNKTELVEDLAHGTGIPWLGTIIGAIATAGVSVLNARERRRRKSVEHDRDVLHDISAATISAIEDISESEEGKALIRDGKNLLKYKARKLATTMGVDKELGEKVEKTLMSGSSK